MPRKQKKKHNSALVAASMGRSAVSHAGAHAYRDGGFAQSGTNLSYREEDGIL
jgi:predicted sugar kinase